MAKNNSSAANLFGVGMDMNMAGQGTNISGGSIIPPQQPETTVAAASVSTPQVTNKASTFKCPKCGEEAEYGNKFCPNCGSAFVYTCPKCGHSVNPDQKFCDDCGEKLN